MRGLTAEGPPRARTRAPSMLPLSNTSPSSGQRGSWQTASEISRAVEEKRVAKRTPRKGEIGPWPRKDSFRKCDLISFRSRVAITTSRRSKRAITRTTIRESNDSMKREWLGPADEQLAEYFSEIHNYLRSIYNHYWNNELSFHALDVTAINLERKTRQYCTLRFLVDV